MAENQSPNTQNSSDEIDLGQLFQLIGKGFNAIFLFFLRMFLYLKNNFFILIGIIVVGLAIGYGLNKMTIKKLKTEIIVKPQMESKNYLYDVIDEVQSNISAKDTLFFKNIGLEDIDFTGLEVSISRVIEEGNTESDLKYLELLQSFENTDAIADIVRAELQNKSSFNHRITFYYNNSEEGKVFANKIMRYINSNSYFGGLLKIYRSNATNRIEQNQVLLVQVDEIIANYTNNLATKKENPVSNQIILDNQEQVNVARLFELKNVLIRDIESKKLELQERSDSISIINFGQPQIVKKSFFGRSIVFIPLVLLTLFFLLSLIKYLNKKTHELY
tara:strand:- start:188 stop:1183 length:996 start_codon:yes stop_codon:yes gene_type:complete